MISFPKPTSGATPVSAWLNQFLDATIKRNIKSIEGYNSEESTDGRKFKKIYAPIAPNPLALETFFPFKIYKPDLSKINAGYILDNSSSTLKTLCLFDPTIPTNFASNPANCNPNTDGWRIWAVRDGCYSSRNFGSVTFQNVTLANDGASLFQVPAADFSELQNQGTDIGTDGQGLDYDIESGAISAVPIFTIVLKGDADSVGFYSFAVYLFVPPDGESALICGQQFDTQTGGGSAFPTQPFALDSGDAGTFFGDSKLFPLGVISTVSPSNPNNIPTQLSAYQLQLGNCVANYGEYDNLGQRVSAPTTPLKYSAGINYRGDFINDVLLQDSVFYPGDTVKIQKAITISGVTTYYQNLWMSTVIGFTTDPTTDANWFLYSGASTTSITAKTPNTLI